MVLDGDGDVDDAYDGIVSILITLPETNSLPLKMDGWNTTFLLGFSLFSGAFAVSFREGFLNIHRCHRSSGQRRQWGGACYLPRAGRSMDFSPISCRCKDLRNPWQELQRSDDSSCSITREDSLPLIESWRKVGNLGEGLWSFSPGNFGHFYFLGREKRKTSAH